MTIEVLISTMFQNDMNIINKMNINTNSVIINQYDGAFKDECSNVGNFKCRMISVNERGLSKSRNLALKYSDSDICIISDDDLVYVSELEDIVYNAYTDYPEADVIIFNIKNHKDYYFLKRKKIDINYINLMRISSVQITFRRKSVNSINVEFNEAFGAGSIYNSGEENIFLRDCLKGGLKIIYLPVTIGNLQERQSTWFKGYNEKFFISKGALFSELYSSLSFFFIIQFSIRKYNMYNKDMTLLKSIKNMILGSRHYKINKIKNDGCIL